MSGQITLTSKLGRFTFDSNVIKSHATLIRDTVTGQWFSPKAGEPRLKDKDPKQTERNIYDYILNHPSKVIASVPFGVFVNPMKDVD